jgi:hypothetical protein
MLHQKAQVDVWLPEALARAEPPPRRLAAVPSSDVPWLPPSDGGERWPNVVVKLANSDEGKDILMGRFTDVSALRAALGLESGDRTLPRQFMRRLDRRVSVRLFPDLLSTVYQAFIPPEVEDDLPRMIRMECFISPLEDIQLSAHATVGAKPIPETVPVNVILEKSPFEISVPPGHFIRLDPATETDLDEVAREFGALAGSAIRRKFRTGPDEDVSGPAGSHPANTPTSLS